MVKKIMIAVSFLFTFGQASFGQEGSFISDEQSACHGLNAGDACMLGGKFGHCIVETLHGDTSVLLCKID